MAEFFSHLFSSDFMAHGHCYLWARDVLWLHVASDGLIGLAYYSIPLSLLYFIRRRRDLAFPWMFAMFGLFIFACGTTHVLSILTTWVPYYRAEGVVKLATAAISVATAVALVPLIPKALRLPSPSQLEDANRDLAREVGERQRAEVRLRALNETLEQRVAARTQELERSNADLERFAYVASHDLTEPLRMVRSFLGLLQRRYGERLGADADEYIGFAVDGAERMQAHIDGLLAYSRARGGPWEPTEVDCDRVLDGVLLSLRVAIVQAEATVSRQPLPTVPGDGNLIALLLQNLVGNALKFAGPQPRVELSARREAKGDILVVRDTGPGIPAGEE